MLDKDKYMFKKEIHDFLLVNGFVYRGNSIAPYCRSKTAIWQHVYIHDKLTIYGDMSFVGLEVTAMSCGGCDIYPLNDMDIKKVTLDAVKQTLGNAGIISKYSDDLTDAFVYGLKWYKENSANKYKKFVSVDANLKRGNIFAFNADELLRARLGNNLNFIITDDFNFERNKTMEQEYQEITMDNLAKTLELNGFKLISTLFDVDMRKGNCNIYYNTYSDGDATITKFYMTIRGEIDLNVPKNKLNKFIQEVEQKVGKLKRLPKEPEFNFEQGLKDAGFKYLSHADAFMRNEFLVTHFLLGNVFRLYGSLVNYSCIPENLKLLIEAADILGKLKKGE